MFRNQGDSTVGSLAVLGFDVSVPWWELKRMVEDGGSQPISSMGLVYLPNIWLIFMVNVGKYTEIYLDVQKSRKGERFPVGYNYPQDSEKTSR